MAQWFFGNKSVRMTHITTEEQEWGPTCSPTFLSFYEVRIIQISRPSKSNTRKKRKAKDKYLSWTDMQNFSTKYSHMWFLKGHNSTHIIIKMNGKWFPITILNHIFLMSRDAENLSTCLLANCMTYLGKCLFISFAHFFNWLWFVCFFGMNYLYILNIKSLSDICLQVISLIL